MSWLRVIPQEVNYFYQYICAAQRKHPVLQSGRGRLNSGYVGLILALPHTIWVSWNKIFNLSEPYIS
jgi:hypothetical protein